MEVKFCKRCGREIEWRKKWEDCWDEVAYCSAQCRKAKLRPVDREMQQVMLEMVNQRGRGKTICPSEVVRQLWPDDEEKWRGEMEAARMAARRLVVAGEVRIFQQGKVVDPSRVKGPMRVGR